MGRYALLVGVSRFSDPNLPALNAPPSDVDALAAVLRDPARGRFDEVTTCLDEDVTTIRDRLSALLDDKRPRDTVLLYYSGHGINTAGNQLFLATGETMRERPRPRSLAASELREMMAESRAGQLIVMLDCCHSGAFAEGAKGEAAPVSEQTFSAGEGAEGQYVLMSCNALQVSLDGEAGGEAGRGLSRFTSWVVEGLSKGEAAPDRPEVTLDDLHAYLARRAREAGSAMTPRRFVTRNAGSLVIAANPAAGPPRLPDGLAEQLADQDWRVRLEAVERLRRCTGDERLRAVVREAVAARLAIERDRDVSEALEALLVARRSAGDAPGGAGASDRAARPETSTAADAPGIETVTEAWPKPPPWPDLVSDVGREALRNARARAGLAGDEAAPGPAASPAPPVPPPLALDAWQQKALAKAGVKYEDLSGDGRALLAAKAQALRDTSRNWIGTAGGVVVILYAGVEGVIARDSDTRLGAATMIVAAIVLALIGLFARTLPPLAGGSEADRRLDAAIPVAKYLRSRLVHSSLRKASWLVLAATVVAWSLWMAGNAGPAAGTSPVPLSGNAPPGMPDDKAMRN